MLRFSAGQLRGAVATWLAIGLVTSGAVWAQIRTAAPPRVHITLEIDRFGGDSYGTWSDVEVEQPIDVLPTGELAYTGLPRDVDLATLDLHAINGRQIAPMNEQRFWPADDSPEQHLQHHLGSQVTVTTTRGDVVGVLRAVDRDSLAIDVGTELRVLRRGAYVQDVRFANSTWQSSGMVTWRVPGPVLAAAATARAPSTMTVRYRTRSVIAAQTVLVTVNETGNTVDISATVMLHNRAEVGFTNAQVTLRAPTTGAVVQTTVRLPQPITLPPSSSVTVPMMTPLRDIKTTSLVVADTGERGRSFAGRPDCSWNSSLHDGALAKAIEFVTPPALRIGRAPVQLRMATGAATTQPAPPTWVEIANGRGLITLGPSTVAMEHQQLDCTVDQANQTARETVIIELNNPTNRPIAVEINEVLSRSTRWKLETSSPSATAQLDGLRFRTSAPANGKRKLSYTVVYAW